MPLVELISYEDGTYMVADFDVDEDILNGNDTGDNLRRLNNAITVQGPPFDFSRAVKMDPFVLSTRRLDEMVNSTVRGVVYGRLCTCARERSPVYCPVEASLCRTYETGGFLRYGAGRILQFEGRTQDGEARILLPLSVCTYLILGFYLIGSIKGRYASAYLRKFFFCWNEERFEQSLHEEIEERSRRSHRRLERPSHLPKVKVPAALKTCVYEENTSHHECMICLAALTDGERVGDLPCGHCFHVDPCLKEWIARKNHCPLCHADNLALPREGKTPLVTEGLAQQEICIPANVRNGHTFTEQERTDERGTSDQGVNGDIPVAEDRDSNHDDVVRVTQ